MITLEFNWTNQWDFLFIKIIYFASAGGAGSYLSWLEMGVSGFPVMRRVSINRGFFMEIFSLGAGGWTSNLDYVWSNWTVFSIGFFLRRVEAYISEIFYSTGIIFCVSVGANYYLV